MDVVCVDGACMDQGVSKEARTSDHRWLRTPYSVQSNSRSRADDGDSKMRGGPHIAHM